MDIKIPTLADTIVSNKGRYFGAGGGTRTHTMSPPTDFESVTSTIPSHRHIGLHHITAPLKFQEPFPGTIRLAEMPSAGSPGPEHTGKHR